MSNACESVAAHSGWSPCAARGVRRGVRQGHRAEERGRCDGGERAQSPLSTAGLKVLKVLVMTAFVSAVSPDQFRILRFAFFHETSGSGGILPS